MTDKQLQRCLQSIGKGCFIKYFASFANFNLPVEDIVEELKCNENYDEMASRTRINSARRIFKEQRSLDALTLIVQSKRLDKELVLAASKLIENSGNIHGRL